MLLNEYVALVILVYIYDVIIIHPKRFILLIYDCAL